MSTRHGKTYEFGPFVLVPSEKQLLRDGQGLPLTPKAFDLLLILVENAGHLMGKEELMNRVWPDSFVEEANLPVKISELRRVLDDGSGDESLIETVPRRGYRFRGVVRDTGSTSEAAAVVEDGVTPRNESLTADEPQRRPSWVLPLGLVAGVLVLAGLMIGLNAGGVRDRLLGPRAMRPIQSLAVLPLEDLSGDPSQEYFAEGMTEALITDLAKIDDLRVISRASVLQYKGAKRPLADIARELKVDALLTGSVVRSGSRVRISVLLVDAATEQNLWAESYERDLRDVIALQNAVTRDVVGRIRTKIAPQPATASYPTVNPEAYDHYLRGKFHLHRQTKEDNEAAINALEQSVSTDPTFAAAHAELAQAYVWKLFLFDPSNERVWAEKAYLASEKALGMDQNLAVAYLARGRLLWTPANRFPHEKAIQEYRKALALDPNLDEARNQLALVYNHIGAFDAAMRELEAAVETNPGNSLARFRIGETLLFQGKHEQALESLRAVPNQTNPALVGHQIVWALFNLGRRDEAASTLEQFIAEHPNENRSLMESMRAVMAAAAGRFDEAENYIESAVSRGKGFGHFHHTAYHIAVAYAQMDRPAEAVKWLETTAETGFPCYPMFEKDKNLDKLRDDPVFANFLAKMRDRWEVYRAVVGS